MHQVALASAPIDMNKPCGQLQLIRVSKPVSFLPIFFTHYTLLTLQDGVLGRQTPAAWEVLLLTSFTSLPSCLSIMPLDQRKLRFFRALAITFRIACSVFTAMTTSRSSCSMSPEVRPEEALVPGHSARLPKDLHGLLPFCVRTELVRPEEQDIFIPILCMGKLKTGLPPAAKRKFTFFLLILWDLHHIFGGSNFIIV